MQLICPNCAETVAAENINIQRMVAVCAACDTVFAFDPPEAKAKRRKVKRPPHLALRDADTLLMTFRTNFRLGKNEAFISSGVLSVVFTFVTLMLMTKSVAGDTSPMMPIIFGLVALIAYYWLALVVYNATHIEMDDDQITVSRRPIPNLFEQPRHLDLAGVVAIRCEETPVSKREAYDTPRYRVWAETTSDTSHLIVTDVTADYAYFIAQQLDERLDIEGESDVSHLIDDERNLQEEHATTTVLRRDGKNE